MTRKSLQILILAFFCLSNVVPVFSQGMVITPEYVGTIMQKVSACLVYPTEAFQKGWEGIAKVIFTLGPDGRVKGIDIAESSGYPLLDAAAILAVKDASPYPFPQNYTPGQELEIILPVYYSVSPTLPESDFSPESLVPQIPALEESDIPVVAEEEPAAAPASPEAVAEPQTIKHVAEPRYTGELKLPPDQELRGFIEVALKNNQPTQVAKQEVELAKLKVLEAQRNLFPTAKVSAYDTYGKTYGIPYEEREAKLLVEQPIYYGGRLVDSVKQAKVNLEITRKNYDRLRLDVVQKTETAYYYLIGGRMHLKQKLAVLKEANELLVKIKKLAASGMIIPLEASSSQTWVDKIKFLTDGLQQDIYMSELTLRQVLNVKESPAIKGDVLPVKRLTVDFDQCLEVALNHRPELYLSQQMVKFNEYGKNIEYNKNKFTVDLTSSVGYYQGAYTTEKMRYATNWFIGVKGVKPLGPNTLSTSGTLDHNRPRLGQTSPTAANSVNAEFALMDNMKRISDAKKSDIELSRALSDFNETSKTVTFEVQDAFLNYQKAVLQMNEAEMEMKFRRQEYAVTEARALAGETSISPAMESLYSVAEAQTVYFQALINYNISLANLKKATGYALDI